MHHKSWALGIICLGALTLAVGCSAGEKTASIVARADATLFEDVDGALADSGGPGIFAGSTNRAEVRRGLVAFDLPSDIPADAIVTAVTVTMTLSRASGPAADVALHRVTNAWDEGPSVEAGGGGGAGNVAVVGDPTWLHGSFDSVRWDSAGGDFVPEFSASVAVADPGAYVWDSTTQLVADVQAWIDDPASNYGWAIIGDEALRQSAKRFYSREFPDETKQPTLLITYTD